ncbi:MAG: hypothetical protein ACRKGH_00905 [Dehalogenimonas sp.]
MLEGKCPKCGYQCAGWGLSFSRHQACAHCGTALVISEDGYVLGTGYSPFTADKHLDIGNGNSTIKQKDGRETHSS